jgi:hypothetical protein
MHYSELASDGDLPTYAAYASHIAIITSVCHLGAFFGDGIGS